MCRPIIYTQFFVFFFLFLHVLTSQSTYMRDQHELPLLKSHMEGKNLASATDFHLRKKIQR